MLDVWREACRHIEIAESTETIARVIAPHMPAHSIMVRRFDPATTVIETVATASSAPTDTTFARRAECPAGVVAPLSAWALSGELLSNRDTARAELLRVLVPKSVRGQFLCGPLRGHELTFGMLILIGSRGAKFDAEHVQLARMLLEPFAAAMENDRRLHELKTLREAAEAERRSALGRLGRKELGGPIVGADEGLRPVMERVAVVARSDVPVLLLGETGSGKEVVARAIHQKSARHGGPFIRVNCGAIPPELIDSQLFGHERGSFTGAIDTHQGWFERADRGTLFLDEVGELPPAAQVRLLRVLQDGYIERVGGKQPIHVDVRVVAATHRDLPALARVGRFREDLWFRLAVFPIGLPPLRERVEDIPALACHFAEKAATRFGLPLVMPTPDDLRLLRAYAWPGNVRELSAVIDRATLLGNGRRLEVGLALGAAPPLTPPQAAEAASAGLSGAHHADAPPPWASVGAPSESAAAASPPQGSAWSPEPLHAAWANAPPPRAAAAPPMETLDQVMRRHIESALRVTYGRVDGRYGVARLLGINPHTLRARMRKLGIDWRRFRAGGSEP